MRIVALLLTILTGFTGLVYEVTWQKCLATLLGSHSEATAAVLGIFLGGLSLGYSLFGRATARLVERAAREGRPPALLRFYGTVEAGIGLYALLFPFFFTAVQALSLRLPQSSSGMAFAADVALTALLIGPPTVLMGGTIPVLTQALARSMNDATRVHAYIYASNTAGAFVGALAGGLYLVPHFGIENVLRMMGLLNGVAGAAFLLLGRRPRAISLPAAAGETGTAAPGERATAAPRGFAVYASIATLLGFAMMASQTVVIRLGGLSLGASHFTFAMVVAVFVLCIALGSLAVSAAPRVPRLALPIAVWVLAAYLLLLHTELENAPFWAHVLRVRFGTTEADFYPFYLTTFGWLFAVLALPVGLSGASLPLLFHHLRREIGDLGAVAGRLYSWNTVGNLLGALLGGYVLLLWLDLHHVYRVAIGALLVASLLLNLRVARFPLAWSVALFAVLAIPLVALPGWSPARLSVGLFRSRSPADHIERGPDAFFSAYRPGVSLHFYQDDPAASVAVKGSEEVGLRSQRELYVNGKPDSTTWSDHPTMVLSGLLPCLMADRCERAFVIGLGTGVTAGELATLDSMQQVVVAEISRGVVAAAPLFDFASHGASRDPRIDIRRSDAYRALLRSEGRYDVITSEPSNPWVSGVEMLFSREFLAAAKSRLEPGGVYAQWFHTYENDDATVELVLRTYLDVFDHVAVWFTLGPDLLLLGIDRPEGALDVSRFVERAGRPDYAAALRRGRIGGGPALLAHELMPVDSAGALGLTGPVHTLLHPRLSDLAARAFFRGGAANLPSLAPRRATAAAGANALLPRWLAARGAPLSVEEHDAVVGAVCGGSRPAECMTARAFRHQRQPYALDPAGVGGDSWKLHWQAALTLLAPDGAPVSLEQAELASKVYEQNYFAALPWETANLLAVWDRCQPADACAAGRRDALARFGP